VVFGTSLASQLIRFVNIVLEVRDNEHSFMWPTDRGNDPTVESDETERFNRERRRDGNGQLHDGNGPLHGNQWTLVHNPLRVWKKGKRVIENGSV
jgi:hypothetical protein